VFPIPQGFVGAEDEETAVHQPRGQAPGDLPLHGIRGIGEDQVAAEDQVERADGHGPADVLLQEANRGPMPGLEAEGVARPLERGAPGVGQVPQGARGLAGAPGAFEEVGVGVGREDIGRMVGRHFAEGEE
jgi:hypothetical protein